MKNITLKCLLLIAACVPLCGSGQWCVPNTLIPYDANMPGITRVQFNTIDRSSADLEHYPNNNYTNTAMQTSVLRGQSYPITISFTIDPQICPDMNLRVWVDLNHDDDLEDAGEALLSMDHRLPSSYTGTITIPLTAMTGLTRMRVTAKMSDAGGHTAPSPCDIPADPFGYHGEMEDYDLNITGTVGMDETVLPLFDLHVQPNPAIGSTTLSYTLPAPTRIQADIIDITGKRLMELVGGTLLPAGEHDLRILLDPAIISPGMYFVRFNTGQEEVVQRLFVAG